MRVFLQWLSFAAPHGALGDSWELSRLQTTIIHAFRQPEGTPLPCRSLHQQRRNANQPITHYQCSRSNRAEKGHAEAGCLSTEEAPELNKGPRPSETGHVTAHATCAAPWRCDPEMKANRRECRVGRGDSAWAGLSRLSFPYLLDLRWGRAKLIRETTTRPPMVVDKGDPGLSPLLCVRGTCSSDTCTVIMVVDNTVSCDQPLGTSLHAPPGIFVSSTSGENSSQAQTLASLLARPLFRQLFIFCSNLESNSRPGLSLESHGL